jgi:hypothetical protein
MSDHDTLPPETDDELRARLRAFAGDVAEQADTEVALGLMSDRQRRPSTIGWLAIAACVLAVVVLASVLLPQTEGVDTTDPADAPTTDCSTTTEALTINPGGQMRTRFALPVAGAATAIMLISACSDDDGPTTIAQGEDIDFVGEDGIGGQTLDISAVEEDGEVTGEVRFNEEVVTIQCADTDNDGFVILGGEVTTVPEDDSGELLGDQVALIIREGDPDRVALHADEAAGSCDEILESVTEDVLGDDLIYGVVEDGEDIATG